MKFFSVMVGVLFFSTVGSAQVYLTRDEALTLYFPRPTTLERKTIFLTYQQVKTIEATARAKVE